MYRVIFGGNFKTWNYFCVIDFNILKHGRNVLHNYLYFFTCLKSNWRVSRAKRIFSQNNIPPKLLTASKCLTENIWRKNFGRKYLAENFKSPKYLEGYIDAYWTLLCGPEFKRNYDFDQNLAIWPEIVILKNFYFWKKIFFCYQNYYTQY